jgi:uncharacterized membrane protein
MGISARAETALHPSFRQRENVMRKTIQKFTQLLRRLQLAGLPCLAALFVTMAHGAEPQAATTVVQNGEAFVVDVLMHVEVPVETAWEVLTDFDHMTAILKNLTSSRVASRDGNTWIVKQEGVARYGLLSFSFASEREIRLEPMKRIAVTSLSGPAKRMQSEMKIGPVERGVQLKYRAEIVPDSILARMFGASFIRHETEEQFLAMIREMLRRHERAGQSDKPSASS